MSLEMYTTTPLSLGDQIDPLDIFVSNGTAGPYVLINKTVSRLGTTIQAGNVQYAFENDGFTVDFGTNSFTLSSAPPPGATIVAPGITSLTPAAYDQVNIPGLVNPNIVQTEWWLGDISQINVFSYSNITGLPGISVSLVNEITGFGGADPSWCQLCTADKFGNPTTFGATGATLYTPPMSAVGSLTASTVAGASSFPCTNACSFPSGMYIHFNPGNADQEILQCWGNDGASTVFVASTGSNFAHASGENIFINAVKGWMKVTIPNNAANNTSINLINLGIRVQAAVRNRF